ncbi:ParA family protein [Mammaliicoccus sciuri]|uniref:ParA family protein n=1 Tax=Mammaliicoccus sciuri TaxID=1296 RepID=UPI001951096D|nr:ParA family protein [Mammaliicoccus sciuri]
MMKVVTLSSAKGGSGKSSLTLNISGRKGLKHRVLVLDLDEQKNTTSVLRETRDLNTIYDVLTHKVHIKDAIKPSRFKNVDYIPASAKISTLSVEKLAIKRLLQDIYNEYDFVVIDTPPSIKLTVVQSAYVASNLVMIPTILDKFSSANLMVLFNDIRKLNIKTEIKIVPSMMVKNSKLHNNVYDELKKFVDSKEGIELTRPLPNSIEISNQMMENKLIANSNKVNKLKTALKKLIDEEV